MKKINAARALFGAWVVLTLLLAMAVGAAAEGETRNLVNGSFEEGPLFEKYYDQPDQSKVPGWSTTAFEGKIELFKKNTGTYINGVTLEPKMGSYAAELNADEESTLYQVLNTEPSSLYEWSLYHGARTAQDTMALIIGPDQVAENNTCLLSKPNKTKRDQFMQMVDWLKNPANYDYKENEYYNNGVMGSTGLYKQGEPIILYSKKFGPNGTFEDNASGNAFSLTPSTIYTEQWYIWLMRDTCATSGTNPWTQYGASTQPQAGSNSTNGAGEYYRYLVPAGQDRTLFGFVSVDSKQGTTYGNFLDCVNFEIFHNVSASRTAHGTAKVVARKAENGETPKTVAEIDAPEGDKASSYVPDGATMTLTANIAASDVSSVVFAGVFYKRNGEAAQFISSGDSRWTASDPTSGGKQYTMSLTLEKGCDLHFVFIKSPTITYDSNGGDPYDCGQSTTDQNVYSFQPMTGESGTTLIGPYTSHAATKTDGDTANPDWRFTGWLMMDDSDNTATGNSNMTMIDDTTGEHRVACNYSFMTGTTGGAKKQEFVVIGREKPIDPNAALPSFKETPGTETVGETSYSVKRWSTPAGAEEHYKDEASGLTFIAQWRWRQTYIPKLKSGSSWVPSNAGGSIVVSTIPTTTSVVTPVTDLEAPVAQEYKDIVQCYFAEQQETMSVTATAKEGFKFVGWYDEAGNLVTTKPTLGYVVGKGDVNVYEARFVGTVVQRYICQIPDEFRPGNWNDVTDESIAKLDHYVWYESPGTPVTSTPEDTADYAFVGWYKRDEHGDYAEVEDSMIANDGRTLSYKVAGNATYYARFVPKVTIKYRVSFDMHNFGAQVPPQTVHHSETATRPEDPVELGYAFGGWYTDDTYATPYNFATPVTQDIVIHAKWNMIWPVDFDMQGHGEPVDRQLVEDGNKATRPAPDPTADGYVFKGWYTEAKCQNEFNFANTPIKGATTVYAKWTANVTVTKEWEGGSAAEVQVRLLKDGQPYDSMPETDPDSAGKSTPQTCEQLLNTTNRWTHTWTNLPADSKYTVEEMVVPGDYTAVYERVGANSWKITNVRDEQIIGVTVTNTHRSDTIGMVIRKEWEDADNRNRPGSIRVRIVNAKTNAVVQEHELNAGNSWTWNVAGLPKRQDGGETVRYLVQEVGEYAGYSAACEIVVEADGSYTVKLTNVLTGKLDIGGEKLWEDGGDRDGLRPDSVQLKIYQNAIAEQNLVRIVQVTAAPNSGVNDPWTWSVQDLPVYDEFGRPITYIVVEDPVPAGYADPGPRRITVTP